MDKLKAGLGFLAVLGFLVPAALSSPGVNWSGIWIGSIDTQAVGVDTITVVLKKEDKTYTGTIEDSLGLIEKNAVLTEVKLEDDQISFSFKAMGGSMDFMMRLSAKGEKISAQLMNKAVGEWGDFESINKK